MEIEAALEDFQAAVSVEEGAVLAVAVQAADGNPRENHAKL